MLFLAAGLVKVVTSMATKAIVGVDDISFRHCFVIAVKFF